MIRSDPFAHVCSEPFPAARATNGSDRVPMETSEINHSRGRPCLRNKASHSRIPAPTSIDWDGADSIAHRFRVYTERLPILRKTIFIWKPVNPCGTAASAVMFIISFENRSNQPDRRYPTATQILNPSQS